MYEKKAVGSHIYVWSVGNQKNEQAVISAHGGQSILNSRFSIPDVNFVFYGPHGYTLTDPGLLDILRGDISPLELVSGLSCQDYYLTKYQGEKHGNRGESYEAIAMAGKTEQEFLLEKWTQKQIDEMKKIRNMDVITIRNRIARVRISLSEVVKELSDAGYKYEAIHCAFCRGQTLPWNNTKQNWDAKANTGMVRQARER